MAGGGLTRSLKPLILKTLAITPSGALSPGPLSASAIVAGASLGVAGGLAIALGHMAFELPYVALLWVAASRVEPFLRRLEKPLNTFVAAFILWFAFLTLEAAFRGGGDAAGGMAVGSLAQAFIVGVVLTGFNAYFLLWWLTVGYPLIRDSSSLGARGFAAMYASHVWMDYAWLALLAGLGGLAAGIAWLQRLLLAVVGLMLALFALDILAATWLRRRLLPF